LRLHTSLEPLSVKHRIRTAKARRGAGPAFVPTHLEAQSPLASE